MRKNRVLFGKIAFFAIFLYFGMKTSVFSGFFLQFSSRYYYYKCDRRLTESERLTESLHKIRTFPAAHFALNRFFSKPDNVIHMENKPGHTFRALNHI